jgi:hypothetical protein
MLGGLGLAGDLSRKRYPLDAPSRSSKGEAMRARAKLLSTHDVKEIVLFQEYLADIGTLSPREFVAKHQQYMGLNDAEAEAYVDQEEKRHVRGGSHE